VQQCRPQLIAREREDAGEQRLGLFTLMLSIPFSVLVMDATESPYDETSWGPFTVNAVILLATNPAMIDDGVSQENGPYSLIQINIPQTEDRSAIPLFGYCHCIRMLRKAISPPNSSGPNCGFISLTFVN